MSERSEVTKSAREQRRRRAKRGGGVSERSEVTGRLRVDVGDERSEEAA
ncbi:hypothetical protein AB0J90_00160 [Micromonospora sp. NPDC049523]